MVNSKNNDRKKRKSHAHYWNSNKLKDNKVRNIMKNKGCTKEEATAIWLDGVPSHDKTAPVHYGNITKREVVTTKNGVVKTKPVSGRKGRKR